MGPAEEAIRRPFSTPVTLHTYGQRRPFVLESVRDRVGVDLPDGVWITRALELRSLAGTRSAFRIPAGATHQVVDLIRQADPRLGYIGDWHSHPADLPAARVTCGASRRSRSACSDRRA